MGRVPSKNGRSPRRILMQTWLANLRRLSFLTQSLSPSTKLAGAALAVLVLNAATAFAQPSSETGGEASLKLPDLSTVNFLGMDGHRVLLIGLLFCFFGLMFGL